MPKNTRTIIRRSLLLSDATGSRSVLLRSALTFVIAYFPIFIIIAVLDLLGIDQSSASAASTDKAVYVVAAIVLAPLIETLLLIWTLKLFERWFESKVVIAAFAAFFWGGLHACFSIWSGLTASWAFFVFGMSYELNVFLNRSLRFVVIWLAHLFCNVAGVLIYVFWD